MIIEKSELIQSVYARYVRGIGGERLVAKNMLIKLLDKQGLTIEQYEDMFCNDEPKDRFIPYMRGYTDLVAQILFAYLPEGVKIYISRNRDTNKGRYIKSMRFKVSDIDYLEIKRAVDVYLNEYKKEVKKQKKALFTAYITTNDLFGKSDPDETKGRKRKPLSNEERRAIVQMMQTMNRVQIRQGLEQK